MIIEITAIALFLTTIFHFVYITIIDGTPKYLASTLSMRAMGSVPFALKSMERYLDKEKINLIKRSIKLSSFIQEAYNVPMIGQGKV